MSIILAYVIIFLLGATPFFEVVGVIPIGVAAGLPALPVAILALLGNILTLWLLILLMDRVKEWLQRRKERKGKEVSDKKQKRAESIWKKYGLPGLTFVAPFLIGSHLGVILAMSFGGTRKQIFFWITVSVVFWAVVMGLLSYFGFDLLFTQTGQDGFLKNLLDTE